MKNFVCGLLLIFFVVPAANAQEAVDDPKVLKSEWSLIQFDSTPFSMNEDLANLRLHLKYGWQGYAIPRMVADVPTVWLESPTICSPLVEMEHTYFCATYKQRHQNYIFSRLAVYNEGPFGLPKGKFVPLDDPRVEALYEEIGGIDLPGTVVREFFTRAEEEGVLLSDDEAAFRDNVYQPIVEREGDHPFFVITVSIQNGMSVEKVVVHEALHAQYYISEALRDAVADYFETQLTDTEKDYVKTELSRDGLYNVDDPYVLHKEFFSYMLEYDANNTSRVKDLARTKGDDLRAFVEHEVGITTIQLSAQ